MQIEAMGRSRYPKVLDRLPNPTAPLITFICLSDPSVLLLPMMQHCPGVLVSNAIDAPTSLTCGVGTQTPHGLCSVLDPTQPGVYPILFPKQTLPWALCEQHHRKFYLGTTLLFGEPHGQVKHHALLLGGLEPSRRGR